MRKIMLLLLIFAFTNILWANLYDEMYEDAKKTQKEILELIEQDEPEKGPEEFYEYYDNLKNSKSAYEMILISNKSLEEYLLKFADKDYRMNDEDFYSIIYITHTWAALYEAIYHDENILDNSLNNISTWMVNILFAEGTIFLEYAEWIKKLEKASDYKWEDYSYIYKNGKRKKRKNYETARIILNSKFNNYPKNEYSEEWYLMIEEYNKIQKFYFTLEKFLKNFREYLSRDYDLNKNRIRLLEKYMRYSKVYFKKLEKISRYHVFDRPLYTIMLHKYLLYEENNLGFFSSNYTSKDNLKMAALELSKVTELIDYTVMEFSKKRFLDYQSRMKRAIGEKAWNELKLNSKLSHEWLKVLPEVRID